MRTIGDRKMTLSVQLRHISPGPKVVVLRSQWRLKASKDSLDLGVEEVVGLEAE